MTARRPEPCEVAPVGPILLGLSLGSMRLCSIRGHLERRAQPVDQCALLRQKRVHCRYGSAPIIWVRDARAHVTHESLNSTIDLWLPDQFLTSIVPASTPF